jgi:hypothetical protein
MNNLDIANKRSPVLMIKTVARQETESSRGELLSHPICKSGKQGNTT